jgi:hypothetical protein
MVKSETTTKFGCPYCTAKFEKIHECQDHIREHMQSVEEQRVTVYCCEVCELKFATSQDAKQCEIQHEDKNDDKYQLFLDAIEKQKLYEAGTHKSQKKLVE